MKNYQHDENFSMKGNSPTACSFRKAHIIRMIKVRHRECLLTQVNTFECFQSSSVQEIWMSYSATAASFIIICNQGRDACDTTQNTLNRPENKNFIWSFFWHLCTEHEYVPTSTIYFHIHSVIGNMQIK